ncbi:hypothetical protein M422DRAFT_70464 [Sphaerobolus stellatus SS14]|uniref:FAD/NAD(P)-binding domain-containing protein n=1 Tax=Sphaerobolus stellatus (strain SS14) TaxID=990650 RepID=A0A0C9TS20_SPHS4|nr:hypothetical protein M422DRAFT_70464 [Sphaerobolus stellatus SS14]
MELNVWTSTKVERVERDEAKNEWVVTFIKADGSSRVMRPKHIVLALGLAGNKPRFPKFPGMQDFGGTIVHSVSYGSSLDHLGKKVVVLGACTAAHDIASDLYHNGIDVTMVQRSSTYVMSTKQGLPILFEGLYVEGGPPVDLADRIGASFPNYLTKQLNKGTTARIAEKDKATLEGLNKVGFQTNLGEDDTGFLMMAWKKAGGYYLDVGASQLIIDGKIKFKHGSVKAFTKDGLEFEDGSSLKADVVVFATGLGDYRDAAKELLGDELANKMRSVWGLDDEGELKGMWRNTGLPNLYVMGGNLALCRFHSTHVALQIKAKEEGVFTKPYEPETI